MNKTIKTNSSAIQTIIKIYGKNIQSLIMSFTGKKNVADIEQEVYIKAWKNLPIYKDEGKLWGWLKKITVNTCKDHLKSKQFNQDRNTDYDEDSFTQIPDKKLTPESILLINEKQKTIIKAIESLKSKSKEVIIMFDIKEMTYEEISRKLKCPTGTVKSRLFNARKQLQINLNELLN